MDLVSFRFGRRRKVIGKRDFGTPQPKLVQTIACILAGMPLVSRNVFSQHMAGDG